MKKLRLGLWHELPVLAAKVALVVKNLPTSAEDVRKPGSVPELRKMPCVVPHPASPGPSCSGSSCSQQICAVSFLSVYSSVSLLFHLLSDPHRGWTPWCFKCVLVIVRGDDPWLWSDSQSCQWSKSAWESLVSRDQSTFGYSYVLGIYIQGPGYVTHGSATCWI